MSVIWAKVWFDLWHMKSRTLLVVLSIAAGVFAIGVMFGMSDQLLSTMDAAHQAVIPAHIKMSLDTFILIISTLASVLPARNATCISVRDSLAYA